MEQALQCNPQQKHLHGRGEDQRSRSRRSRSGETPPRTWRRRGDALRSETRVRNTSTDVEKTSKVAPMGRPSRKHLHGRGEDRSARQEDEAASETPPRTWRRLWTKIKDGAASRNTSTDVEKTLRFPPPPDRRGNTSTDVEKTRNNASLRPSPSKHLHGRGEDSYRPPNECTTLETPPRTWRRQKTPVISAMGAVKHLHGRGEDSKIWH